ncbi:unnamed protein product [Rhizoctonia solani]|uniref:Fungal lipase-type domain-containing protein n=1 Tax=Rhizoctonia solani TaxID=456999 RepID=A0A8H2WTS1_9AGAM|nr:unnamed protein product [Rhizoctonia solani]
MAYNAHQQVFSLSLMTSVVREIKGTQAKIQSEVEKKLPEVLSRLPGWQIAWGPVVWKHRPDDSSSGPDHVLFVARHPHFALSNGERRETYVLAIAGSVTRYNWVTNNGRVNAVVDFHRWLERGITTPPQPDASPSPENCYIAIGTALGVYRLSTVAPPPSAVSPGVEIPAYWASFPESPNTRVILTGHSLGAALSSTLALGLLESRAFAKFSPSNILVYSTAGPAIGNLVFAKLFSKRFPKISGPRYEVWNSMIVNLRDPVSQAWCTSEKASPKQNMNNIPTIYGEPAIFDILVGVAVGRALANCSLITYMPLQAAWFEGTPPSSSPTSREEFLEIVWEQHTGEFLKLLEIKRPQVQVLTGEEMGLQRMSSLEVICSEPVISELIVQIEAQEGEENASEDYKCVQALSADFVE